MKFFKMWIANRVLFGTPWKVFSNTAIHQYHNNVTDYNDPSLLHILNRIYLCKHCHINTTPYQQINIRVQDYAYVYVCDQSQRGNE